MRLGPLSGELNVNEEGSFKAGEVTSGDLRTGVGAAKSGDAALGEYDVRRV